MWCDQLVRAPAAWLPPDGQYPWTMTPNKPSSLDCLCQHYFTIATGTMSLSTPEGCGDNPTRCCWAEELLWPHFGSRRLCCGGHAWADRETLSGDLLLLLSWEWASQICCLGLVPQAANGSSWLSVGLTSSLHHLESLSTHKCRGYHEEIFFLTHFFFWNFFLLAVLKNSCIKVKS